MNKKEKKRIVENLITTKVTMAIVTKEKGEKMAERYIRLSDADSAFMLLAIGELNKPSSKRLSGVDAIDTCNKALYAISTADVKEVVHGEWIIDEKRFGDKNYHCNKCGAILEEDEVTWRNNYFCYHCGADMRPRGE